MRPCFRIAIAAVLATGLIAVAPSARAFVENEPEDDASADAIAAITAIAESIDAERRGREAFVLAARDGLPFDRCSRYAGVAAATIEAIELANRADETHFRVDDAIVLAGLEPPRPPVTLLYGVWVRELPRAPEPAAALKLVQSRGPLALAQASIALPALAGPRARMQSSAPQTTLRWQSQVRMARPIESSIGAQASEVLVVTQASTATGLPELQPLRAEQLQVAGVDPVFASAGVGLVGGLDLPFDSRLDIETNIQERRFRDGPARDGGVRSLRFALGTPVVNGFSGQIGLRRADESPRDAWLAQRADEAFLNGHWSPRPGARFTAGYGVRRVRFAEFDLLLAENRDDRQGRLTFGFSDRFTSEFFGPMEFGLSYAEIRTRSNFSWNDNDRWEARVTVRKNF